MSKKHHLRHTAKKRKLHPLLILIGSLFAVLLLVVTVTAYVYKDTSPLEQVAGAATSSAERKPLPSLSPTQTSCVVAAAVIGYAPCGKDMYHGVSFVCGDGKKTGATSKECRSLTAWMTQVAQMCSNHSSCRPSGTPTPKLTP